MFLVPLDWVCGEGVHTEGNASGGERNEHHGQRTGKRVALAEVAAQGIDTVVISASFLLGDLFSDHPLVVTIKIGSGQKFYQIQALVDTGCSAYALIDPTLAQYVEQLLGIQRLPLGKPKRTKGYDGNRGQDITHAIYPGLTVHNHCESTAPLLITPLGQHPVILGKPWMKKHGVMIDMKNDTLSFTPGFCDHPTTARLELVA